MSMSLYAAMVLGMVVLAASMLLVELGLSIAVVEIVLGIAAGNLLHLQAPQWLGFLASFGSIVLSFLAGAEVDPSLMRDKLGSPLWEGVAQDGRRPGGLGGGVVDTAWLELGGGPAANHPSQDDGGQGRCQDEEPAPEQEPGEPFEHRASLSA